MAQWGGYRKGAGRPANPARTAQSAARLIERAKQEGRETPLDFLWRVAMDEHQELPIRIDCAKAVSPYLFPRLSAVAVSNPDDNRVIIELRDFSKRPVQSGDAIEAPSLALEHTTEIAMNVIEAEIEAEDQEQEAN